MGWLNLKLIWKSAQFHFDTHWVNQTHFWSGVVGMLVNNALTLLGIWAMLFAGKLHLVEASDMFFVTNFILMVAWGFIHIFLGGIARLDSQINEGGLDLAMTTPRSPFLTLSLTTSDLPAWGDFTLGLLGLMILSFKFGFLFLLHVLVMLVFASLSLYAFFIFVGCMAFWFRRTEAINSMLVNFCLAFNTYPFLSKDGGARWILFLAPILLSGVIPASYIMSPSMEGMLGEILGSFLLYYLAKKFFYLGMRRYQSTSFLGLQRG